MTFTDYLSVLRRRWRIWVSGLLIGLLAAIGYNYSAPVKYTAVTTMFVTVADAPAGGSGGVFQGSQFVVQRVKSYADLTSSPEVTGPVIQNLNLDLTDRQLRDMVTVTSPADSVLLHVNVTDSDPQRAAAIANQTAEQLAGYIEELETPRGTNASTVKVSITKPSVPPSEPSAPRVLMNIALGLAAGLALGLVGAVIRHLFDRRLKTLDDVRAITGTSTLGDTLHNSKSGSKPLVALDVRSAAAERYRSIRAALKFASVNKPVRQIAVTSSFSNEGKSTLACNLAIVFAQGGMRACLVESDLRRPNAHRYLGVDAGLGLTDVLIGDATLKQVIVPWREGLIDFLPAGSLPPDPVALLGSGAMQKLSDHLAVEYDVVIYDCPPVIPVTDALVLGQQLDGLLVVARAGKTRREDLTKAIASVDDAGLRVLGTVLVGAKGSKETYYQSKTTKDSPALTDIALPTDQPLIDQGEPAPPRSRRRS